MGMTPGSVLGLASPSHTRARSHTHPHLQHHFGAEPTDSSVEQTQDTRWSPITSLLPSSFSFSSSSSSSCRAASSYTPACSPTDPKHSTKSHGTVWDRANRTLTGSLARSSVGLRAQWLTCSTRTSGRKKRATMWACGGWRCGMVRLGMASLHRHPRPPPRRLE